MKYNDLALLIRTPIFSKNDLLLAGKKVQDYQFTLWAKKGYLVKLKNGIYAFAKDYEKIKGEEIASVLYQPSYLSLESALSFYGFIPEMEQIGFYPNNLYFALGKLNFRIYTTHRQKST